MNKEILDAIVKTLPQMQVEALQAELKKAAEYSRLVERLNDMTNGSIKLTEEISTLKAKLKKEEDLAKYEEELRRQDQNLKITLLQKDLDCAKEVANEVKQLAMAAFKNPTVTKTFNMPVAVHNQGYVGSGFGSETTSTE